jgi:hypothetical protein
MLDSLVRVSRRVRRDVDTDVTDHERQVERPDEDDD